MSIDQKQEVQRARPFAWHVERFERNGESVLAETIREPMHPDILANLRRAYTVIVTKLFTGPQSAAAADVLAERQRQIDKEGWTSEGDDEYTDYSLTSAAIAYAMAAKAEPADRAVIDSFGPAGLTDKMKNAWPDSWSANWFKPTSRRRDLVKSAALLLAEIERLDRAAAKDLQGAA